MEKVIHQMWYQGLQDAPGHYEPGRKSWKRQNPGYEYIFWDEPKIVQLLEQSFPHFLGVWLGLDSIIKKCDAARYMILYEYGGVYADLDTFAYKSIDALIEELDLGTFSIILSEESHDPESWKAELAKKVLAEKKIGRLIGNAVMISHKNQIFWLDFLEKCFDISHKPVLDSFSTWHLSTYVENIVYNNGIVILPSKHLLATKVGDASTYVVHSYDQTWFDYRKNLPWEV